MGANALSFAAHASAGGGVHVVATSVSGVDFTTGRTPAEHAEPGDIAAAAIPAPWAVGWERQPCQNPIQRCPNALALRQAGWAGTAADRYRFPRTAYGEGEHDG